MNENKFEQTTWTLRQLFDGEHEQFTIESIYGEKRPKLMPVNAEPATVSRLLSSNRADDGYRDKTRYAWTIEDNSDPVENETDPTRQGSEIPA